MKVPFALLCAALFAVLPKVASAQTSFSQLQQFSPGATVLYVPFIVSVAGTFRFETLGTNWIDPAIRIYEGAATSGTDLGPLLARDDDSGDVSGNDGFVPDRGETGAFNALVPNLALGPGGFVVALSVSRFEHDDAVSGVNSFDDPFFFGQFTTAQTTKCDDIGWTTCNYTLSVTSEIGVATRVAVTEPGLLIMMATGLLGIFGLSWRRRVQSREG